VISLIKSRNFEPKRIKFVLAAGLCQDQKGSFSAPLDPLAVRQVALCPVEDGRGSSFAARK